MANEYEDITDRALRDMLSLDEPEKPDNEKAKKAQRKQYDKARGRETLSEAKNTRKPTLTGEAKVIKEAEFVAAYLKHGNATRAYQELHPDSATSTAQKAGRLWLKKEGVKRQLEERREEARQLAVKEAAYDLQQAHKELEDRIERASAEGQHNAVASLMREKLKLWKLVDSKEATAQAGFSITINSADGETRVVSSEDLTGDSTQ